MLYSDISVGASPYDPAELTVPHLPKIEIMNLFNKYTMAFPLACGRGDLWFVLNEIQKDPSIVHKAGLAGWTPSRTYGSAPPS